MNSIISADQIWHTMNFIYDFILTTRPGIPPVRRWIRVRVEFSYNYRSWNYWRRAQIDRSLLSRLLSADAELPTCDIDEYPTTLFVPLSGIAGQ